MWSGPRVQAAAPARRHSKYHQPGALGHCACPFRVALVSATSVAGSVTCPQPTTSNAATTTNAPLHRKGGTVPGQVRPMLQFG
jgi:hypothetical protein